MEKKRVSLVLSSGGARGIAHIAIIEELERRGYEICSVAGTSMGAFVGGIFAAGKLPVLKEWMYSLSTMEIVRLFDFSFGTNGLVKGDRIFQELSKLFPDVMIEEMALPFVAISTDIIQNVEVIHDKGSLFNAIRSSISIPTFFKPIKKTDSLLVDGGLLNPAPVNRVRRVDNDLLFVVNVETLQYGLEIKEVEQNLEKTGKSSHSIFKYHGMPGYIKLVNKTIGLMLSQLAELTIEKYNPDLVINFNRELFSTYDFHKYAEIMETGQQHAVEFLDRYEQQFK
jgi:NTE family protein